MSMLPSWTCTRVATVALPALLAAASAMAQTGGAAASSSGNAAMAGSPGSITAARCASLSGEFQAACEVRIMGAGAGSGSGTGAGTAARSAVKIATEPLPKASEPESATDASVPTVVVPLPKQ